MFNDALPLGCEREAFVDSQVATAYYTPENDSNEILTHLMGDNVMAENVPDEQRKFIKCNLLVANTLAFHNIVSMTKAIDRLKAEGQEISNEVLAAFSPYQTSHINRFGQSNSTLGERRNQLPFIPKPPSVETGTVSLGLAAAGSFSGVKRASAPAGKIEC